ncbi:MAG: pirin family protein [Acidimicrobiia bacterium]
MIEVFDSRVARVGELLVRRALPRREHRTVGAWCFADHMGPSSLAEGVDSGIGPHPHIGLQTVTWLVSGELRHRDSVGSDQVIKPGQLNLMTAGHGVVHAEEASGTASTIHGIQLWVAQPEATRHGDAAFEHHAELPRGEIDGARFTVLVGSLAGVVSPARRDTDHFGAEIVVEGGTATRLPLDRAHEHAIVVVEGAVRVEGAVLQPGNAGCLAPGLDQLVVDALAPARFMLLGGVPFASKITMWWNFVARSMDEVAEARSQWERGFSDRFPDPCSPLARIAAPPL